MTDTYYTSQRNLYLTTAKWGADGLDPPGVAARVLQTLDRTAHLVPPDQRWYILDRARERYAPVGRSLTGIVRANEIPGDFGEPNPGWGYSAVLRTLTSDQGPACSTSLDIGITAGSNSLNSLRFEIGDRDLRPDFSRVSYQTYRDMIGAIAEAWPCPWIFAENSRNPRLHPPADVAVNGPLKHRSVAPGSPTFPRLWPRDWRRRRT